MTVYVFGLLFLIGIVGVLNWVRGAVTQILARIGTHGSPLTPAGTRRANLALVGVAIEFVAAVVAGLFGGSDAWSGLGIFIVVLGGIQLAAAEVIGWCQIVVSWLKARSVGLGS